MKSEINRVIMAKLESRLYNTNFNSVMARGNVGARAKMMKEAEHNREIKSDESRLAARGSCLTSSPVQQE